MKVPFLESPTHPDYRHNCSGVALWNLCLMLKPTYVVELGTWQGTSAMLVAKYLEKHRDGQGAIVTADVVTHLFVEEHPLVEKVQVYPHTEHGLEQAPWATERFRRSDWKRGLDDSVTLNTELILKALRARGGQLFDLAYVDGDHSEEGLLRDLEIVKQVTAPPHYALLDDVYRNYPAAKLYQEQLRDLYNHYDFDDGGWEAWETWLEPRPAVCTMPRMALVWSDE